MTNIVLQFSAVKTKHLVFELKQSSISQFQIPSGIHTKSVLEMHTFYFMEFSSRLNLLASGLRY